MIAVDTNVLVYGHRREIRVGDAAHALPVLTRESDFSVFPELHTRDPFASALL